MATSHTWLYNCTLEDNGDGRCTAIYYARGASAVLAIVGCFIVFLIVIVYRKYQKFTQRMVFYMLMPSVIAAATSLYPKISNHSLGCEVVGCLFNFGILSQRLLVLCLIIHLLTFVSLLNRPRHLEAGFHIFVWIGSLGISAIPLFGNHYGSAGVWCWIKDTTTYENELRLGCFYVWMLGVVLFEIAAFIAIILKMRNQLSRFQVYDDVAARKRAYKKAIYPLLAYPLVDLILAVPVTITRIHDWIDPEEPVFWLYLLHSMVYPAWGFLNALMYLMNKETLQQMHPARFCQALTDCTKHAFSGTESTSPSHVPIISNQYRHAPFTTAVTANPAATEVME